MLSAEWKSPSKIIARTGPGKGKGDIIVVTKSGGQGSCTVGFKGYFVQIGKFYTPNFFCMHKLSLFLDKLL